MRKALAFLVALAAVVAAAGPLESGLGAVSCHRIEAAGVGQDLGGGSTIAQIADGGLLQGTTAASFAPVDFSNFPPILGIAGTVTFTTNKGTLTVAVAGTMDVSTGAFEASGDVTDATGKLTGATGSLSFVGVEDLATGAFTETVTGSICVDLGP
jgi:hypothetical protein